MMTQIEIVYERGYCEYFREEHNRLCYSEYAYDDMHECDFYAREPEKTIKRKDGKTVRIGSEGCCMHAKYETRFLGWAGKRYEIIPNNWQHMSVWLGNRFFEYCSKVVLNGKCIFNTYDPAENPPIEVDNGSVLR